MSESRRCALREVRLRKFIAIAEPSALHRVYMPKLAQANVSRSNLMRMESRIVRLPSRQT